MYFSELHSWGGGRKKTCFILFDAFYPTIHLISSKPPTNLELRAGIFNFWRKIIIFKRGGAAGRKIVFSPNIHLCLKVLERKMYSYIFRLRVESKLETIDVNTEVRQLVD